MVSWYYEAPNHAAERLPPLELAGEVPALEFLESSGGGAKSGMNSRLQGTGGEIGEGFSLETTQGSQGKKRQGRGCSIPSARRGGCRRRALVDFRN